ncbi:MAG: sulfatase-like hydrolase/transferase [Saprospiraceae bacterium]|nr:sulfatase-like hydrolase/transferase [Saprospiraceae bacterium]
MSKPNSHNTIYGLVLMLYLPLVGCKPPIIEEFHETRKPNILLIMADDLGFGDIASHGNPYIRTPRLSALKQSSVVFEQCYVSPVCAPTRASLLTGKYHQRVGVQSVTNGYEVLDPDAVTIGEWLEGQGYRNGIFGKWHLGEYEPSLPLSQGFHEFIGFRTGHTADYVDAVLEQNGHKYQSRGYITRVLTDAAWAFMRESQEPFFCYLPYNVPHTPLQIDSHKLMPYLELDLDERTARIYAMIEDLDNDIGMLMDSLQGRGMLENTIIIFMSDNGPISGWKIPQDEMRFNAGLRDQKFTVYEGGIRSPSYWMWQGTWPAHQVRGQVTAHIDVLPTLLDIIGVTADPTLDGISVRKYLEKANVPANERFFFQKYALGTLGSQSPQPGGIVRHGVWKMVNGNELYKLDVDRGEKFNLANRRPGKLDSLNVAYHQWWTSILAESDLSIQPIKVGLDLKATIDLQPHHGTVVGDLKYTGHRGLLGEKIGTHPRGVDGDWIANWQESGDAINWHVNVAYEGPYTLELRYRSTGSDSIPSLSILANDEALTNFKAVNTGTDWQWSKIDTVPLAAGKANLSIQLEEDVETGFELRSLSLQRLRE